jgi:hypothetical protein
MPLCKSLMISNWRQGLREQDGPRAAIRLYIRSVFGKQAAILAACFTLAPYKGMIGLFAMCFDTYCASF